MKFPTMWYVRPAKPHISLRICANWSEPLQVACQFYVCLATDWASFGVSKLKRRLHRLIWVYTCQNATLLEIWCRGSIILCILVLTGISYVYRYNKYHSTAHCVLTGVTGSISELMIFVLSVLERCFYLGKHCGPRWNSALHKELYQ